MILRKITCHPTNIVNVQQFLIFQLEQEKYVCVFVAIRSDVLMFFLIPSSLTSDSRNKFETNHRSCEEKLLLTSIKPRYPLI